MEEISKLHLNLDFLKIRSEKEVPNLWDVWVCGLGFLMRNCRHADCEVPDLEYKVANGMPLGEAQMLLGGVLRCQVSQQGRNHLEIVCFLKYNFGMKPNKGSKFWESPHLFEAHIVFVHQRMSETCQHLGKIQHMDICHQEECATSDFWRWSFFTASK